VFPPLWTVLKGLITASIFVYLKSLSTVAVDAVDSRYLAVYILFVINVIMAKTWTLLFFKLRYTHFALVNAFVLAGTAIAITVLMGVSSDIVGDIWPVPMSLFIPYAVWLTFAVFLNYDWLRMELGYPQYKYQKHHKQNHHKQHNHHSERFDHRTPLIEEP
jgi:tryptophan-rich sensory protein